MDFSFVKEPLTLYVTLVRFVAALWILYEPLPGVIGSICLDGICYIVMKRVGNLTPKQLEFWDKNVDWLSYAAEITVAAQFGLFMPFMVLLFYRFMGHFMFLRLSSSSYYLLFPNLFEAAFVWLVIFFRDPEHVNLYANSQTWIWLAAILIMKIFQEYLLHTVWPVYGRRYDEWEKNITTKISSVFMFRR